jgi:hypothetical protein
MQLFLFKKNTKNALTERKISLILCLLVSTYLTLRINLNWLLTLSRLIKSTVI